MKLKMTITLGVSVFMLAWVTMLLTLLEGELPHSTLWVYLFFSIGAIFASIESQRIGHFVGKKRFVALRRFLNGSIYEELMLTSWFISYVVSISALGEATDVRQQGIIFLSLMLLIGIVPKAFFFIDTFLSTVGGEKLSGVRWIDNMVFGKNIVRTNQFQDFLRTYLPSHMYKGRAVVFSNATQTYLYQDVRNWIEILHEGGEESIRVVERILREIYHGPIRHSVNISKKDGVIYFVVNLDPTDPTTS